MTEAQRSAWVPMALALACLLLFGWGAPWTPLFDLDEGAFSQATLEMLRRGDWLRTWLNGEPRYDKPMLTYWLQAASVSLFGVRELAFRLPSILATTAWVLTVHRFALEELGRPEAALLAAGSLALALMVGVIGHAATADGLLNLWLCLAFVDIFRHWRQPRTSTILRVFLWMGLGFLTKGPVALGLPVLASLGFYLIHGSWRDWLKAAFHPLGWVVLLGVTGIWLVPLFLRGEQDFLWQFLGQHNAGRFTAAAEGHGGGPWYYLLVLPLVLLPFTALLPGALGELRSWRRDPLNCYLLLWFAVVFVIVSLSATKLPHYALYGSTPLFLLFGRAWDRLPRPIWLLLPALLFCALLASLPWTLHFALPSAGHAYERGILELALQRFDARYTLLSVLALTGLTGLLFLPWARWQRLLLAGLLQAALVWGAVVPVLAQAQQQPVRDAARLARKLGAPTVSWRTGLPSFSVYRGAATEDRLPEPGELVFLRRDRIARLRSEIGPDGAADRLETLYERGGVALLRRPEAAP